MLLRSAKAVLGVQQQPARDLLLTAKVARDISDRRRNLLTANPKRVSSSLPPPAIKEVFKHSIGETRGY